MSNFKKHKRIYYVPGIISLILIPLILWSYGTKYIEDNDYRVLRFNMPPKDYMEIKEFADVFDNMKYDDVKVPPNFTDETEVSYFNLIRDLQEKNIDKTAIRFQFSHENTYGDIVKLLNLMEKTEHPRYGWKLQENTFEVIHIKSIEYTEMACGGDRMILQEERKKSFLESFMYYFKNLPKYIYPIIIGYLLLIICSIFRPKIFIPIKLKN